MLRKEFIDLLFEYFSASHTTLFDITNDVRTEEVTPIHYNILEYLYFNQGAGLTKLADCMYLSLPNASREVRKLTEAQLIKKVSNVDDKRKTAIFLTDQGKAFMDQSFSKLTAKVNERYKELSPEDQIQLESQMKNIMAHLFNK